MLSVTNL